MSDKVVWLVTDNADKVRDFRLVFDRLGVKLKQLRGVNPAEGAISLLENAYGKALAGSRKYPERVVMATDGGVEIPYLGKKWNPVLTKRLGGLDMDEKMSDRERAEKLIELMRDAKGEQRLMVWREAVVIMKDGKVIFKTTINGGVGYLMEKLPKEFKQSGFWLGYVWRMPAIGRAYMLLTDEERFEHGTVKQSLWKRLKQVDIDDWFRD
ncbi:MAG: hypothetical protein GXP43_01555 [bacterium]|nr:hypothetical protein [bacterium]